MRKFEKFYATPKEHIFCGRQMRLSRKPLISMFCPSLCIAVSCELDSRFAFSGVPM